MMTAPEPDGIVWQKSSYSVNNGGCVEVAPAPDRVLVRDSKDPEGPALTVPTPTWRAFLRTVTP
jgi:Domain of unknown function (DUF397)